MKARVVYESMFGNCKAIAEAVGAGMTDAGARTQLSEVGGAPTALPPDLDLLVVGGPNHYMALTTPKSRVEAERMAGHEIISRGRGLREWLSTLEANTGGTKMAIFDCRLDHPDYISSPDDASLETKRLLFEKGFEDAAEGLHIYVKDKPGPLVEGEAERARSWGASLAAALFA